ncbi:50S ribosomal protein L9 [Achromatium sp. WMS2]|nr:50S ribosomal protein L9 [Achromatium sp. WMS2]
MEVILLKRVEHLGNLGDRVAVKPGYGRNYLLPTGRAVIANVANIQAFEEQRNELERDALALLTDAEACKAKLADFVITIARRAGDEGRLFGSVTTTDIAAALQSAGHQISKRDVRLPTPLRSVGVHEVMIHLHSGVDATITVEIIAEE